MTCFSPLQGYESNEVTAKGKRKTTFSKHKARCDGLFKRVTPCRRCVGCRNDYAREWAIRMMHESTLHEANSFITLTYNDQFLPAIFSEDGRILGRGTLNYEHFKNFMKRFRKALAQPFFDYFRKKYGKRFNKDLYWRLAYKRAPKVRYYMGPEYGDQHLRPHYHAIIFGYDFPDKVLHTIRNGHRLYRSEFLESLWTCPRTGESYGYSSIGSCTFESAAYVARYMMKKVKGDDDEGRYRRYSMETGEEFNVEPEKAKMSNRDGIGKKWFDSFAMSDVYNKDFVTMNGLKVRPPKYYDSLLERFSPEVYEDIRASREQSMADSASERTPERLAVRETVFRAKLGLLKRDLHKEL
jgi:hypothetical protein